MNGFPFFLNESSWFSPSVFFLGFGVCFLFWGFFAVFFFLLISVQLCSDHTYFSKFFCNRILYFQFVPKLCESYLDRKVPRLMGTRWTAPGILRGQCRSPARMAGASWSRAGRRQAGGRPTASTKTAAEHKRDQPSRLDGMRVRGPRTGRPDWRTSIRL